MFFSCFTCGTVLCRLVTWELRLFVPFPPHQQLMSGFISTVNLTMNSSVYMAAYVMYSIQARMFHLPVPGSPLPSFPTSSRTFFFPICSFSGSGHVRFSLEQIFSLNPATE